MVHKRLIATLVIKQGIVVQSIGFQRYLPVGRAEIAARFLDQWGVDEICLLDIDASREGRLIDPALVKRVSRACYVPLSAGGGICSEDDIHRILDNGADKVVINSAIISEPALLERAAALYGSQCLVASLDARKIDDRYEVFVAGGREATGREVCACARTYQGAGAGEILLNSIDRDGMKNGYDLALIDAVAEGLHLPVIVQGGAGHPEHVAAVLQREHVSAAAVANMLHFSEHSVATIKAFAFEQGVEVRMDSQADYRHRSFLEDGRLAKLTDEELAEQFFEFIPEEVI